MAVILNTPLARQFLEALYGHFFSQAQGAAFLEVRGKREGQAQGAGLENLGVQYG